MCGILLTNREMKPYYEIPHTNFLRENNYPYTPGSFKRGFNVYPGEEQKMIVRLTSTGLVKIKV